MPTTGGLVGVVAHELHEPHGYAGVARRERHGVPLHVAEVRAGGEALAQRAAGDEAVAGGQGGAVAELDRGAEVDPEHLEDPDGLHIMAHAAGSDGVLGYGDLRRHPGH